MPTSPCQIMDGLIMRLVLNGLRNASNQKLDAVMTNIDC